MKLEFFRPVVFSDLVYLNGYLWRIFLHTIY